PGVLAVFTGADVEGLGTMTMTLKRKRPDGSPMFARPHRGLSRDRARYVGDPVALVLAETRGRRGWGPSARTTSAASSSPATARRPRRSSPGRIASSAAAT